jgi:aldehyde dehydrogenase (NAD+)
MEHVNPTTGRVTTSFPLAGLAELEEAVAVARQAQIAWGATSGAERAVVLHRVAAQVRAAAEELNRITVLEAGIPAAFAGFLTEGTASRFDYYAGWTDRLVGEQIPVPGQLDYTIVEPYGVVALVLTWNAPFGGLGLKVASALAAGCAVVVKSPELAPFSAFLFAEICARAGVPQGLVTILPGTGEIGAALVAHPGIDKVSFTGGPQTGRQVQIGAAKNMTPVLLELGGKSANLVFADADLHRAIASTAAGITMLSGQVCVAPSRLLVHTSVHDQLVDGVLAALQSVPIGDPSDASTLMGPVINDRACDRLTEHVQAASDRGDGKLLYGGTRMEGRFERGFFIKPAIFDEVDNASQLAQQEFFGPVLAISRFESDDEAIALANATEYGLAAYLHTNDLTRAHTLAAKLDAGSISVNGTLPASSPGAPFGGFKGSGYGKEGGIQGVLEFCRLKNVSIALA